MKWVCVTKCVWGKTPGGARLWEIGETVNHDNQPCRHFQPVGEVQDIEIEEPIDKFATMTKAQINEQYGLGINQNTLRVVGRETLIKAALEKHGNER